MTDELQRNQRWRSMMHSGSISRRGALQASLLSAASLAASHTFAALARGSQLQLKYIVGSCMYGYLYVGEILPEIARCGAAAIDLWPKKHGNQREQLTDLGEELFVTLLNRHQVTVGCITQYALGPFGLQDEMRLAQRLGCSTIVTGGVGPKGLKGSALKSAVAAFVEKMQPHLEIADSTGVTIAIENHGNNLFESADSLRYLADLRTSQRLGVALAPYHLPQDPGQLAELIRDLGPALTMFYAWQHGDGCMTRLPKEQELLQLPGRGPLDFGPLLEALATIQYSGWTEIFMHPVPRGIPIMETAEQVTAEINRSREYLDRIAAAI